MLSVSRLAHACGLSRSTVLYYESIGLLRPSSRSPAGYRRYGPSELDRLRSLCAYRGAGLKIRDIAEILSRPSNDAAGVLHRRLLEIADEINKLREHQLPSHPGP
ncbi:MAG: MerR family transcriptional regulator [Acidimicrobiia bacterium]|nr:MerR family transcriptional regulator [Acidimicrobiia bacterium]